MSTGGKAKARRESIRQQFALAQQGQGLTQEQAAERRLTSALDEEIEEAEQRFKTLARRRLGGTSLLGSAAKTPLQRATGSPRGLSSPRAAPTLLSGGSSRGRPDSRRDLD